MIELSQSFGFEAAHTLARTIETEGSARIHGHSYRAELVLRGPRDPDSGMLVDLGVVAEAIKVLRERLDHRLLDLIEDLGPGTMENLAAWIFGVAKPLLPQLARVVVRRDSLGQVCSFEPDVERDTLAEERRADLSEAGDWGVAKR